jgi:hypothetical protein
VPDAEAVGASDIVNVLSEVASTAHGEYGEAVRVIITLPAVISAALGVYVQADNELGSAKVPDPLEDHNSEL